jgi:hypothetical protein
MAQPGPSDETTLAPAADTETRLSSEAGTGTGAPASASSGTGKRTTASSHSGWLSTSQSGDGRFASGTILADRYRIIGLAGRGGMGEVYRADDLRLGQPVALKFLPESVCRDPTRLAQFHNEVRTARQISHRNVCRVYDIGEADDRIFLTMEYVDGEDLSTLLRRVGRFPSDRAIEIARQICAGLAAAHELNVLHRDLKPANVMLDGDGRVRITDFGLAGLAGEIKDIRAGTPAYMAPEQLAGREVSIRSDIFALGLVLYEIFTGKRAFEAKNVAELLRMHDEGLAITPTSAVRDMDPAVERVILRCLDRDPQRRPPSALAVAAALPGGDPLAAALAAGETPSPEMVANAGHREAIHAALGVGALGVVAVLLGAILVISQQTLLMHRAPFDKPPEALLDRARTVREALGYRQMPTDNGYGFGSDDDYFAYVTKSRKGPDRWRELPSGREAIGFFWYRTSPRTLAPIDVRNSVTWSDPPFTVAGMTSMRLDARGRLFAFEAVPPQIEPKPAVVAAPNWDPLFVAADLPKDRFTPATPEWAPRTSADARAAWTGTIPELGSDVPVRLEAAAANGRITSFQIVYPWTTPRASGGPTRSTTELITGRIGEIVRFGLVLLSIVIGYRNFKLGRGNRAGAFRIAAVTLIVLMLQWILRAAHVPLLDGERDRASLALGIALFQACQLWLFYIALEPTIRRFWPDGLISWNRLLQGKWRDPLVGWHLLCGVACGITLTLALHAGRMTTDLIERGAITPWTPPIYFLDNTAYYVGTLVQRVYSGLNTGLLVVLVYAFARGSRAVAHRKALAIVVTALILSGILAAEFVQGTNFPLELSFLLLIVAVCVIAMLRFGLWALCVMFFVNQVLHTAPFTLDSSDWFAATSHLTVALLAGMAIAGFVISRGGEPLFGRVFAET